MSEVIVVTSGKGGVGKTTTSANVGTGLAMLGEKVVLIDTDIGLRNLDVVMGLENRIVYNLVDVVEGNCRMKQALKNAIAGADRAFVVTTPEVSAIRDADRIIGLLEASEITKTDLIVNRIRMDMVRRGDMMSIEDVTDILGIPILGAIPDDAQIVVSTNQGEPIVGMNPFAGQAYLNICRRVLGQEVPLMDLEKSRGIFSRFQGFLKRA